MKKYLFLLLAAGLLTACGSEETAEPKEEKPKEEEKVEEPKEEKKEESKTEEKEEIDTSVFEYATEVEITDAIDINQHVTLFVIMSEEVEPGLAVQHVVNQIYDFLLQDDIEGAKTISVNVKQGDMKIATFTVNKDEFTPNDEESMSDTVMAASEMEFMTPEVQEYGKAMDSW